MTLQNPIAEIMDTFFNGRPAPKASPQTVRVRLTAEQIAALMQGKNLKFKAGGIVIELKQNSEASK